MCDDPKDEAVETPEPLTEGDSPALDTEPAEDEALASEAKPAPEAPQPQE